ncbi:MAG TPA: hypothetical protein VKY85_17840 [Candidatus Angelobacter sp.]|nr:hypothetical protein [Candidatus Angelobacter sp.]
MEITIPKKTGTYADALHAIGASDLLHELCGELPQIIDQGSEFKVVVAEKRSPQRWPSPSPGYPYIWDSQKEQKPPTGDVLDYRAEIDRRNAMREFSKQATKGKTRKQVAAQMQQHDVEKPAGPKPELVIASMLASMRKGWSGDRQLYRWLTEDPSRALAWTKFRLNVASDRVPDPSWSNTQFLNPITGKGVHSAKTVAKAANAINSELVDPFEDWLRLRACFKAMLAYRDGDDFKFFVIEPTDIAHTAIERVIAKVRDLSLWGGVRLDILAVLRATETLIGHSEFMPQGSIPIKGKSPRKVIAGFCQAYFKSLGTAAALMNNALLPFPDWFDLHTSNDALQMLMLIKEFIGSQDHPGCLNSLDEKHSDDGAILQQFRNWLNSGELVDFLSFTVAFALHLMQRRARQEWARPFSTENLTFLLSRGYNMNEIVSNPGFLSIARAVRNATIYSVGDGSVDIETRFGLAQKWKQKLKGGDSEFLGAVGEFIQDYNWEVIHRRNRKYHVISTTDLDQLAQLIQGHGAETVGLLLLAYGYAQAPKAEPKVSAQGAD